MVFNQIRRLYITLDATDQATRKLKQVDATADATGRSMQQAAANARKFRRRLVAVGFGAAILTGAMAKMVTHVSEVTRTFGRIQGASGATEESMSKIRSEANRIGAELPVRINEAAQAFEQLSYAGLDAEQSLAAAGDVVNLAVAGNLKMGNAAKTAASSLNAFQLQAEEVAQITNTMAATFSNSALNIQELSKALGYVQSVAQMANQTFNEMTAAIGTLADAGLRASRAGTALERMFIELSKQSASTQAGMEKLGLTMDDFETPEGDFRNLTDIVQVLGDSLQGMEGVDRIQALQETFGSRGARAAALLVENTDEYIQKVGDNARAEINDTIRTLDTLSDQQRQAASAVLGFTVTGEEGAAAMLRKFNELNVSTDELAARIDTAFNGISTQSADILAKDLEALEALQAQASEMSDSELESQIQTEFNMGEGQAEQFAQRVRAGESFGALAESIKEMTTASDIAEEQMKSLWGQIEFLKGSIDSLVMKLVAGMKPALDVFFGATKAVVTALNEMPGVVKGIGLGLAALNAILIALTVNYAYLATANWVAASAITETAVASALAKGYHLAHAAAVLILGGSYGEAATLIWLNTGAVIQNRLATAANTVAQWAATAAKYASAAATWVLTTALSAGGIVAGAMAIASWAVTAALYALQVGAYVASAAIYVLYNVATGGLINILYALAAAIMVVVGALGAIAKWDIGGWGDEASGALSKILAPVYALIDAVKWLGKLMYELGELALIGTMWALSGAFAWSTQRVKDFVAWLAQLPIIGPAVQWVLDGLGMTAEATGDAINWLGNATEMLGAAWAATGIMIGDAIRSTFPYIETMMEWWDTFTSKTNAVVGAIATLIEDGLQWLDDTFTLLEMAAIALGASIVVITGPIGVAAAAIAGAAWLIYDNWSVLVGWFETGMAAIGDAIDGVMSWLSNFADMLGTMFPKTAEMIAKMGDWWSKLEEDISSSVASIVSIVYSLGAIIANMGEFLWNFVKAIGMIFKQAGEVAYDALMGWLNPIIAEAMAEMERIWNESVEYVMGLWNGFVEWLEDMAMYAAIMIALPFALAYSYIEPYLDDIMAIVDWAWGGIVEKTQWAAGKIVDLIDWIVNGLVFWIDVFAALGTAFVGTLVMITSVFTGFLDWMLGGIDDFVSGIEGATAALASMSPAEIAGELAKFGEDLVNTIVMGMLAAPMAIYNAMLYLWNQLLSLMPSSDADEGPLSNLTSWGKSVVMTLVDGILSAPMAIANAVIELVTGMGQWIKSKAIGLGKAYIGFVLDGVKMVGGFVKDAILGYFDIAGKIAGYGMKAIQAYANGLKRATGFVANALSGIPFLGDAAGFMKKATDKAIDSGLSLITGFGDGIKAGISKATGAIRDAAGAVRDFLPFSPAKRGPLSSIGGAGSALMDVLASGISGAKNLVVGAVDTVMGAVKGAMSAAKGVAGAAMSLGEQIAGGIADGVRGAAGAIKGAVDGAVDGAKNLAGGAAGAAMDGANAVGNAAKGVVGGGIDAAGKAAGAVGSGLNAAGDMAGNVAGGVGNTAGGIADAAGSMLGGGGSKTVKQANNMTVRFDGEVHDAQKVADMVKGGMDEAAKEAESKVEDGLDMASDAAGDAGDAVGDAADSVGDALGF